MRTIRGKIMVTVLVVSLVSLFILAVVFMVSLSNLRGGIITMSDELGSTAGEDSSLAMERQITEQLTQLAQAKAATADEKLGNIQTYVQMTADYLTGLYDNPDGYLPQTVLPPDPALAGTFTAQLILNPAVADDPARIEEELALVSNAAALFLAIPTHDSDVESNYFSTTSGINIMIDNASDKKPPTLDASTRSWFQNALYGGELIWTDVFDDTMGRGLAITCAAPFFDRVNNRTRGVVGFGSLIDTLSSEIIETQIGETGYAFVINDRGQTIISPNIEKDENGAIIREDLTVDKSAAVRELAQKMLRRESGVSRVTFQGREVYMAYEPMEVLPWTVVTVMDVEEALAPAEATRASIAQMTEHTITDVNASIRGVIIAIVVVFAIAIVIVVLVSAILAKRITRPLGHLIDGVGRISGGDLDTQIQVETKDEIAGLANAFNDMTGSLKHYISDLTAVTAEKERIGAELGVATQIQASMLPCIFPPFPDHEEFDIYATMEPAKEVGGDFYDFFLVDENHLGFVVADVSGKGVPAALFMVIAKTLIKNRAQNGESPSDVLTNVNNQLCENNDAGMFVTCWMAVLDMRTGELVYANAGHNAPLLKRRDGAFEYLHAEPGFVLAGLEGMAYSEARLTLEPGDQFYLYTDGVTEATDLKEELYGEDRLQGVLNAKADLPLTELLPAVKADIDAFVGEAPQFDDITMLTLRFHGTGGAR